MAAAANAARMETRQDIDSQGDDVGMRQGSRRAHAGATCRRSREVDPHRIESLHSAFISDQQDSLDHISRLSLKLQFPEEVSEVMDFLERIRTQWKVEENAAKEMGYQDIYDKMPNPGTVIIGPVWKTFTSFKWYFKYLKANDFKVSDLIQLYYDFAAMLEVEK